MTQLTVYFSEPWWVAVVEVEEAGMLRAYRQVLGSSEPSNEAIYDFVLHGFNDLLQQSAAGVIAEQLPTKRVNPKRAQRLAAHTLATPGVSTKAQEALRVALEANKLARQACSRQQRDELRAYKRAKKLEKAQARKRGH